MKTNKKTWSVIILAAIVVFFSGCKPKEIIAERVITKSDSTVITRLNNEITRQNKIIETLTAQLKRSREEISRLESESSSHKITYDTTGPVNPETGKYPIYEEIITDTRSKLSRTIKEMETMKEEYNREINDLEQVNSSLNITVEALKEENSELRKKVIPTTGFNFKLFLWGMIAGSALSLFIIFRKQLRKFLFVIAGI